MITSHNQAGIITYANYIHDSLFCINLLPQYMQYQGNDSFLFVPRIYLTWKNEVGCDMNKILAIAAIWFFCYPNMTFPRLELCGNQFLSSFLHYSQPTVGYTDYQFCSLFSPGKLSWEWKTETTSTEPLVVPTFSTFVDI